MDPFFAFGAAVGASLATLLAHGQDEIIDLELPGCYRGSVSGEGWFDLELWRPESICILVSMKIRLEAIDWLEGYELGRTIWLVERSILRTLLSYL